MREQVASWRAIEDADATVGGRLGGGVTLRGVARAERTRLRRRARALRLLGFRELAPGLAVRPDNLAGGVVEVRARLVRLGLEPETIVAALTDLDDATEARGAPAVGRRAPGRRLPPHARRRSSGASAGSRDLAPAAAMTESFLLGGRAIRQIVLDPLLPEPLVPAAERAALVETMRRYDRAGRAAWSTFMRDAGTSGVRPPGGAPRDGHARTPRRHRRTRMTQMQLTRDEISDLSQMSDWRSWLSIAVNWALVAAAVRAGRGGAEPAHDRASRSSSSAPASSAWRSSCTRRRTARSSATVA